tara:strand:+ start:2624 stop:3154 length:531 start_codon:yes stop_codon:yes gene_type:complete
MEKLKFIKIPKFFNSKEISILKEYCKDKHYNNFNNFEDEKSLTYNADTFFYKDFLMEVFLKNKKKVIEKKLKIELSETYSYWRCYTYASRLDKHKDRNQCEISVTACIDSDKSDWPIFMEGVPITLKPGEAIIYSGTKLQHWREPFTGDYNVQLFLHYVNKNGKFSNLKGDNKNED